MPDLNLQRLMQPPRLVDSRSSLQNSRKWTVGIILLALSLLYLYLPVLGNLAEMWWERDDYSHGFLIPFISLYLIWHRRERLKELQIQPAFSSGFLVVITAGSMLVLGKVGSVVTLQELSLVVMIAGLVLSLLGGRYLRALSFPIAYLLLMIPITDEFIDPLHWAFQLMTAKMGVGLLQALGFAAYLENQYIFLPRITLEVAEACSGIKYLISIIALGIPLAYITQKILWCRIVLVISAVIIGIIGNWIRVAAIGAWAYYGGEVLHGPFHVFQALFVAQLGFIALFVGAWILSKVPVPASENPHFSPAKDPSEKQDLGYRNRLLIRSWLGISVTLTALIAYLSFYDRGPIRLNEELALFPASIGDWSGEKMDARNALFRVRGADDELVRIYTNSSGNEIQLYVAYFESQNQTKEVVNYLTAALHHDATEVNLQVEGEKSITVNRTRIKNGRNVQGAFFWYDLNGKMLANPYRAKVATTFNSLIQGRTNGAFVLVTSDPKGGSPDEGLCQEETVFIRNLVPVLSRYLPQG